MRRDTIFYRIFAQSPTILFDLLSQPPDRASEYTFDSVEVKETSFRIDGVFLPPNRTGTIYFCEVQFQDEVNAMLGIELEQTRVYQDAKAEGKAEEGRSLVLKLLTRKLGRSIDLDLQSRVNSLTIEQIEALGEALLDFQAMDELVTWLNIDR